MNVILLPQENLTADRALICDKGQLEHIRSVLGAGIGDTLKIGQLHGKLGTGVITAMTQTHIELGEVALSRQPPKKLGVTVLLALPRPKVLRRLMMDMAAIGVDKIVLMNSYRTDKSYWGSPLLSRIDEFVLEGLAQGVDTVPPQVALAKRFKIFAEDELPVLLVDGTGIVAHPYAARSFGEVVRADGLPKVLAIGAEGGFIDYEIGLLERIGMTAASVGTRILRTESAVNALLGRWLL